MERTKLLTDLIGDIQTCGKRIYSDSPSDYRTVGNEELADFLILNNVIVPPVKVGQRLKDKHGDEYIIVSYKYVDYGDQKEERIEVMDVSYEGKTIVCINPLTVEEFFEKFGEVS